MHVCHSYHIGDSMRTITQDPETTIPDIRESDIKHTLIVAVYIFRSIKKIAFAYRRGTGILNWYGGVINDRCPGPYLFSDHGYSNLLCFITMSWDFWNRFNSRPPYIYIVESSEDLESVFNEHGLQGTVLQSVMIHQFAALNAGVTPPIH